MSTTDPSFDAIRSAIGALWPPEASTDVRIEPADGMLLLQVPSDVAAFAVFNGNPGEEFRRTYGSFRRLYRKNSRSWDERTLSFVACRSSDDPEDDGFYAALEADPLFCRKYVIRAHDTAAAQREELLRLPFLPLLSDGEGGLQQPQPAQDLLQSVGISSSFARNLVEPGKKAADRIADELRDGRESLPATLSRPSAARLSVATPRAASRLATLTVEGFRAYRDAQTFDLDAPVIVLYGPNGLGKTSFFDAIDYACTGRIGRLCRIRRSQSEFARIASHLDKTPGSGSVMVTLKGLDANSPGKQIQRSTGDWGTAWIDGQETDRKGVINAITQAQWLDIVPRLPNLESLFRATHLFGQGEQELLTEFQNGSIIPEAFVSETLSLQDYSAGLAKVRQVLSELAKYEQTIKQDLTGLREESAALTTVLKEAAEYSSTEPTPIESAIADLRQEIESASVPLERLPEVASVDTYEEWYEVAMSRSRAGDERVRLGQSLRDELPVHHEQVKKRSDVQRQLDNIARELEEIRGDDRAVTQKREAAETALKDTEAQRQTVEDRLQELRSASKALSERSDLTGQMAALTVERDRHALERADIDSRLTGTEAALAKGLVDLSEVERRAQAHQSELKKIEGLLDELAQHAEDRSLEAEIHRRIGSARQELTDARGRYEHAKREQQSARRARELRQPEYERAIAAQAEVATLLDRIRHHVHDQSCPLCGSQFESVDRLLASIGSRRESTSQYSDVTTDYQALAEGESQATEQLQVASAEVAMAEHALEELQGKLEATNQRLRSFDGRVASALGEGWQEGGGLREVLERRQEAIGDEVKASEAEARTARVHLAAVEASRASDAARRKVIQRRLGELESAMQDIMDSARVLTARIESKLPGVEGGGLVLTTEMATGERTRDDLTALVEKCRADRRVIDDEAEALNRRGRTLSETRSQLVVTLGKLTQATSSFRRKLQDLGASDDRDSLERVIRKETEQSDAIRAGAAKVRMVVEALQARALRQRLVETRQQLERAGAESGEHEEQLGRVRAAATVSKSIEGLLKRERQSAIERHIGAYGPVITMIQQRLRSVYGFGEVQLEAHGAEARVRVEWRSKSVHVPPTDFFSDSQKQILMLSIFMAGALRQNWSGFAPVLLDDPVTHFDDLNSYAFVELIRGMVATAPHRWQFVVSTCEQRLFDLMKRKFSRLSAGAIFYEFLGMTAKGPIIERR
jgi:exonuclease SbcC